MMEEFHKYTAKGASVGKLLCKLLMQNEVINTRATASQLTENFTNHETYITKVKSNTENFNYHIKVNAKLINTRFKRTYNLMANMFKVYHVALDTFFSEASRQRNNATITEKSSLPSIL